MAKSHFLGTYGDLRGGSVNGQSILLVPPEGSFEKQADAFNSRMTWHYLPMVAF